MTQSKEDRIIEAFAGPYRRHRIAEQVIRVVVVVSALANFAIGATNLVVPASYKILLVFFYFAFVVGSVFAATVRCPNCEYAMLHVRFYCKNCGVRLRPYRGDPSHAGH